MGEPETTPELPEELWGQWHPVYGWATWDRSEIATYPSREAAQKDIEGSTWRAVPVGVHPRWRDEAERLRKERDRVRRFIKRDDWATMNNRRADLIDRDVYKKDLTAAEAAELKCLQVMVAAIVDVAHPLPDPDEMMTESLLKLVDKQAAEIKRLKATIQPTTREEQS